MSSEELTSTAKAMIIAPAHSLDMRVTAEGVEKDAQPVKLINLECNYAASISLRHKPLPMLTGNLKN
jgi:EAL domain-containing protein (putative c-di-GMP-specific phosphodiesterase class I)